jgi:carboxymethylenebutenolidase
MEAEVYVAAAENDRSYPPEMADRLGAAMTDAGVTYRTETYPAEHGWMMPDFPVYDENAAERGWKALSTLYRRAFR